MKCQLIDSAESSYYTISLLLCNSWTFHPQSADCANAPERDRAEGISGNDSILRSGLPELIQHACCRPPEEIRTVFLCSRDTTIGKVWVVSLKFQVWIVIPCFTWNIQTPVTTLVVIVVIGLRRENIDETGIVLHAVRV